MALSIAFPPRRSDSNATMPLIEINSAETDPPPMLTSMLALGISTGKPAPIAAAKGSYTKCTSRVPISRINS